jgi:hypothetical protein
MKNKVFVWLLFISASAYSQTMYMTRNGNISFFSRTPMENIDAINNEVTSMINSGTGDMAYAVLIKSFRFQKALMEEHFNENYMESSKFPKATFSGKITNLSSIDFTKNGTYDATVEGELTIRGMKKQVTSTGTIVVDGKKVTAISSFTVRPSDFEIKIPSLVKDNIAETIEVKVNCIYEPKS